MSAVDHPKHYNSHPSGVECITIIEHMGFNIGNAIKYLFRLDHKQKALEDLSKARWYISREVTRRTSESWALFPSDPRYEVSSAGRIRRLDTQRIRALVPISNGYLTFGVALCGRNVLHYVHHAVVETFFGAVPEGKEICHRDGIRVNNHITNLRVDTRRGNHADRYLHGTHYVGAQNPGSFLDYETVQVIRSRTVDSDESLASEFCVSRSSIQRIRTGASWADPRTVQEIAVDTWIANEPDGNIREVVGLLWRDTSAPVVDLQKAINLIDDETNRRTAQEASS